MIFVFDVGNTNIVLGVYKDDELKHHWRIETNRNRTADEFGMIIKSLFEHEGLALGDIDGIIISSVVPPIMLALERMCQKYFQLKPLVVGPGLKTGLDIKYENPREVGADRIVNAVVPPIMLALESMCQKYFQLKPYVVGPGLKTGLDIKYENPREVGADRIVNAVAAIHEYGSPLVIVDFGTATTYCYINEHRQYMGGAIAPGINISTEALYSRAAKLPRIEIVRPDGGIIGKNTVSAMQAGILYGYVGQVEGIVKRIMEQSIGKPTVIATGGLSNLIAQESNMIDIVDPYLTLKGLQLIYKRNMDMIKKGQ